MKVSEPGDGKYYKVARPRSIAEGLVIRARDQIYKDFIRVCRPRREDTILDVGISDIAGHSANFLERLYPYRNQITAVGLGTAEGFQMDFPEVRYLQIAPNARLPFDDGEFAIATSNAVLEHVGTLDNQIKFVAELSRVSQKVFISVPNRFFPIEHHTAIPILHYLDTSFALACKVTNKTEWMDSSNLILMSKSRLRALWPPQSNVQIALTGIYLGPFSSNILAYCDRLANYVGK